MSADPFEPLPLFTYPLFSSMFPGHEQHNPALRAEILAHRERNPGSRRSNRNGWHSSEAFMALRTPAIAWLLDTIDRYAKQALAPYYDDWAGKELRMGSYWANVLGAGGFNAPHHHLPQHWSGVYYIGVGGVSTDPGDLGGWIEFVNPNPTQSAWGSGNFAYAPRAGLTLLFPASLTHYVHPHGGDEARISVAYNLNVVAK